MEEIRVTILPIRSPLDRSPSTACASEEVRSAKRSLLAAACLASSAPEEARSRGRYVHENDERADVLVARTVPTRDGVRVAFDDLWERRRVLALGQDVEVAVPTLDDLILTKRFGGRSKDLEDIRLLEALRSEEPE